MSSGMICANCGKGVLYGHNMSHAKNRTNRTFLPNLHPARVTINGTTRRIKLCIKCLRIAKKKMAKKMTTPNAAPLTATV